MICGSATRHTCLGHSARLRWFSSGSAKLEFLGGWSADNARPPATYSYYVARRTPAQLQALRYMALQMATAAAALVGSASGQSIVAKVPPKGWNR